MSLYDTIMGDTVGVVYSALSGVVDPWTKSEIVENNAAGIVQASNSQVSLPDATTQANADATTTLQSFPGGSADPSGFSAGVGRTLGSIGSGLTTALTSAKGILIILAVAAVAVGFAFYEGKK